MEVQLPIAVIKAAQKAAAKAAAAPASQANLRSCKEMDGEEHLGHLAKDLRKSVDCAMAMCTYDDPTLHSAVLAYLGNGGKFRLCADKGYVSERPKLQALLSDLQAERAEVRLGKGGGSSATCV